MRKRLRKTFLYEIKLHYWDALPVLFWRLVGLLRGRRRREIGFRPEALAGFGFVLNPQSLAGSPVAVVQARDYRHGLLRERMQTLLAKAGPFVRPGARVTVKVCMAGVFRHALWALRAYGFEPAELYWTHPAAVRVLCELLRDLGAGEVVVVEALFDRHGYIQFGYERMLRRLGGRFIDLNFPAPYPDFVDRPVGPNAQFYESFKFNRILVETDTFVSFSKLKRHHDMGISLTLKNLVGLIPVSYYRQYPQQNHRSLIHQHAGGRQDLAKIIVDLLLARPIDFAVIDGVHSTLGSEGPWNHDLAAVAFNTLVAGRDAIAVDAVAAGLMGYSSLAADFTEPFPVSPNYLAMAARLGLGSHVPAEIPVVV